jgi:U6 snRNA-associated Sm-like protein LSm8
VEEEEGEDGGAREGGRAEHPAPPSPPPPPPSAVVTVVCNDGRVVVGTLRGFDQATNLVLADCSERVFSRGAGVETLPLGGLHVVRGDNVALVGETDAGADAATDWGAVRAAPLPPVTH